MKHAMFIFILIGAVFFLISCSDKTSNSKLDQVMTPVLNPGGYVYADSQHVTITSRTSKSAIYYSLDGSTPSTRYDSPVVIGQSLTLKAVAKRAGMLDSDIVSADYSIGVIPLEMKQIAAGSFIMGRSTGSGSLDELPTHQVSVSAFSISEYEVSQAEWLAVMGTNPSRFSGVLSLPVENISWYAALLYCNKLSLAEGKEPVYSIAGHTDPARWGNLPVVENPAWDNAVCDWSANGYRLPTEAEWEFAARGGSSAPDYVYSGSNNLDAVGWYCSNSGHVTKPCGQKTANALGLCDLSGNLAEWVWDRYGAYAATSQTNPAGPAVGDFHIVRGGAWVDCQADCRLAKRYIDFPYNKTVLYGLRVVRSTILIPTRYVNSED